MRVLVRSLPDFSQRSYRFVQSFFGFRFGRLEHQILVHYQREIHCGRMNTEIEHGFCHVHSGHPRFVLERFKRKHKLVHTNSVVRHGIIFFESRHEIIGVEHRFLRGVSYALRAQSVDVNRRAQRNEEIAVKALYLADRQRAVVALGLFAEHGCGEEGSQLLFAADGTAARTAAAVRRAEGLVQVEMNYVEAHVSGTHHSHNRVEVCAVVIAQTARLVHYFGDFQNIFVKQAQSVGVCKHKSRRVVADKRFQSLNVHSALAVAGNGNDFKAAHVRAGGICAVRRVGHKDFFAFEVVSVLVVLFDQHHARKLAVRACRGLKRNGVHARDFAQLVGQRVQNLHAALGVFKALQGVHARKAGQSRDGVVDAGIVLHRAAAERIKTVVHAVSLLAQSGIVAYYVYFGHLGQSCLLRALRHV